MVFEYWKKADSMAIVNGVQYAIINGKHYPSKKDRVCVARHGASIYRLPNMTKCIDYDAIVLRFEQRVKPSSICAYL